MKAVVYVIEVYRHLKWSQLIPLVPDQIFLIIGKLNKKEWQMEKGNESNQ